MARESQFSLPESAYAFFKIYQRKHEQLFNSFLLRGDRLHFSLPSWLPLPSHDLFIYYHPDDVSTLWEGQQDLLDKKGFIYNLIRRHTGRGIFTMENSETWKMHQKIMGPHLTHFDRYSLSNMIDQKITDALADTVLGITEDHRINNPHRLLKAVSMQINTNTLFGVQMDLHQAATLAEDFTTVHDFIDKNVRYLCIPEVIDRVQPGFYFTLYQSQDRIEKYANDLKSRPATAHSILEALRQPKQSGEQLTDEEIREEIIVILAAGHGTIATAVTNTLHLLALPAQVYLQDEIRRQLLENPQGSPSENSLLTMSFQETLRLYPPVYMSVRRAREEIMTENERGPINIPKGSTVALSPYLTHRHPDFWTDAQQFNPERFLQNFQHTRNEYIPFGVGKRRCLGEHLAMEYGVGIMASMLRRYRLTTDTPVKPQFASTIRPTKNLQFLAEGV